MKCTVKYPLLVSQNCCPRWTEGQQWAEEQHQLVLPFMGDGEAGKLISRYIKQFRPRFTFGIYHHAQRFFCILAKITPVPQNVVVLGLQHYTWSCTVELHDFISNLASTLLNTRSTMQWQERLCNRHDRGEGFLFVGLGFSV